MSDEAKLFWQYRWCPRTKNSINQRHHDKLGLVHARIDGQRVCIDKEALEVYLEMKRKQQWREADE